MTTHLDCPNCFIKEKLNAKLLQDFIQLKTMVKSMKSWLQNIPDGWLEEGVGGAATEEGDPHHQLDGPGQLLNYDAAGSEEDTSIKEELADQDPLRLEQNEAGFLSVKDPFISPHEPTLSPTKRFKSQPIMAGVPITVLSAEPHTTTTNKRVNLTPHQSQPHPQFCLNNSLQSFSKNSCIVSQSSPGMSKYTIVSLPSTSHPTVTLSSTLNPIQVPFLSPQIPQTFSPNSSLSTINSSMVRPVPTNNTVNFIQVPFPTYAPNASQSTAIPAFSACAPKNPAVSCSVPISIAPAPPTNSSSVLELQQVSNALYKRKYVCKVCGKQKNAINGHRNFGKNKWYCPKLNISYEEWRKSTL